jgi:hypothetical protein
VIDSKKPRTMLGDDQVTLPGCKATLGATNNAAPANIAAVNPGWQPARRSKAE